MDRVTETDAPWEEALDLDDEESPLRPLKRLNIQTYIPALQSCSSLRTTQTPPPNPTPARLIPGPAGVVQAAMLRRKNHVHKCLVGVAQEDPIPTQEYIRRVVEDGGGAAADHIFSNNPWLDAVDFVRREGLVIDADGAIGIPLRAIKSGFNEDKVPQVVAIIASCSPNGLGDMMVTLKDPTGTIRASIHRKALTEGDFGKDISVGAVVIIQKVAVFSTSHVKNYLNITLRNVVKVFSRDDTAPVEQSCSASAVKPMSPPKTDARSWMPHMPSSLAQEKAGGIMNNLRQNPDILGSEHSDYMEKEIAMTNNSTDSERSNEKQSTGAEEECMLGRQDVGIGGEGYAGTSTSNNDRVVTFEMLDPWDQASKEKITRKVAQDGGPEAKLAQTHNDRMQKIHQPTSKASLPQWTDEQLDELFAFD